MHYFQHNIGDYRSDTGHLTLLEHGVYRQLLDQYYLDESPITTDRPKLMRSLCARNADEMQAVENVLSDFFVETESGFIHKRCDVEIEAFHGKSKSASESAKSRWNRVRAEKDANALQSQSEPNANHKPLTINQEPLTINQESTKSNTLPPQAEAKSKKGTRLPEDWVLPKPWGDWAINEKPHLSAADIRLIADMFKDYWIAKAGRDATKANWEATWRNWVRRDYSSGQKPQQGANQAASPPVRHKCGVDGCDRMANVNTPRGHRCAGHISK